MKKIFFYPFLVLSGCSSPTPMLDLSNDFVILQSVPMKIYNNLSTPNSDSLFTCKELVCDSITSEKLISTNILVIGTKRIIESNMEGIFEIDGLQKKDTLLFQYIGYIKKKVSINDIFNGKNIW